MARGGRSMCAPNLPAGAASQPASLCFQFRLRELDGGTCCFTPEPVGQQPRRITGDFSYLLHAEEQERKGTSLPAVFRNSVAFFYSHLKGAFRQSN